MDNSISLEEHIELVDERFELAKEGIDNVLMSTKGKASHLSKFFNTQAWLCSLLSEIYENGGAKAEISYLKEKNKEIYADILPENYENSYTNPDFAEDTLGAASKYLCAIAAEMRGAIPSAYEGCKEGILIRMELLLECFGILEDCVFDDPSKITNGQVEALKDAIYFYVFDYTNFAMEKRVVSQIDETYDFFIKNIEEADFNSTDFLYRTGEYITRDEEKTAEYLAQLDDKTIQTMADTFTEGYRIGFIMGRKDITKKKTVNIRYTAGFERVIRASIDNFNKMGLKPTIFRQSTSILEGKGINRIGMFGAAANKQFDFDHKEDLGIVLDKKYVSHKLEILKNIYEAHKQKAFVHGGPAVMEIFGEADFNPENKSAAVKFDEKQQKLSTQYTGKSGLIVNEYIKGEERSFTIIAFPVPAIGGDFDSIFNETIKINTLDYTLYQGIQQKIIDTLDECKEVYIGGKNSAEKTNRTSLTVKLHSLTNSTQETIFENCVADVNIPVGEVFTSPVLTGTNGILHVNRVFLNELAYENLWFEIKDGMITDYGCDNFPSAEEGRKLIKENILYHHNTLPMGEFAIGTNTTAFRVGRQYNIEGKLPILIAEKTGPHFAFGDTCYSHSEDLKVYNPDGKEIIARDNECSMLRNTDIEKAYFNCHTDVTIPYDEIGEITGIKPDGSSIQIIRNGKFVLEGCEELNKELEKLY